ncbi:MAG: polysaccharide biosynthesis tyrosine autokinase [Bryobacteraceae bacterium]|nr:polysaccharide biosynthesis tyrosine autokinase [Bryobacteraceae bacterium]MDW8379456.1 polysaccharide biosynthesis tyrosine autokinase [Bryobacterales bacterium]
MPLDKTERELMVMPEPYRVAPWMSPVAIPEPEGEEEGAPLSHYFWVFRRHRWKILAFVTLSVLATAVVSTRITPIYESTATVDVDRQTPTGVVGQESTRSNGINDADQFLATQVKLIQSDSVLRPVAQKYQLLRHEGQLDEASGAAAAAGQAPIFLRKLKVNRPSNTYLLLISYRSPDPQLAADVANAVAQSYLEHTYYIRYRSSASLTSFMEKQLEELRAKMEQSSAALLQFERELNVINPEEKTNILSARLIQLNSEYTNAQADRVRKQAAYQSVRNGSLEAAQVSGQGEPLRRLTEKLNEAQERFSEIKAHYGAAHPEYRKAAAHLAEVQRLLEKTKENIIQRVGIEYEEAVNREAMIQKALQETKAEFDRLNARSFEYQALKREAEADKKLYEELVRKIKEAGINASFQNSAIRIADMARPALKPVFPNIKLNLALAFVFSTLLALGAAVVSDALDNTIRDPEHVARTLKTEVVGTLPVVKDWRSRLGPVAQNGTGTALVALSEGNDAVNGYAEAIRTLRNSILLSDFDRRLRSLLVTSASPGEGKSTIAAHLAATHASQHHRTLLIDGDLRRPSVHKRFGLSSTLGLSNVLLSEISWREALVKPEGLPELDVLPAGPPSRRAADLIGRGLLELLEEAAKEYDLVVLDAPPLLGFAEPLQMATAVDGVVVVTRAGETSRKAVGAVLATLGRLRANVIGLVLNQVHQELSDSYYYYSHYGKYYRPNAKG